MRRREFIGLLGSATAAWSFRAALICVLQLGLSFAAELSHAQTRKPTANEVTLIRDCVTKNKDNLDESERQCLFNLVAESCINKRIQESIAVDCYRIEELRNSAFQPVKSRACIGSADFDAFRDEASAIPEGAAILERLPTPRHQVAHERFSIRDAM